MDHSARTVHEDLDLYQVAYLCGGPIRVAQVALLGMYADHRIEIGPARQRITVINRNPRHPVEAAAFELLPDSGSPLWPAMFRIAAHPAISEVGAGLRMKGLLPRRKWPRPRRGHHRRGDAAQSMDPGDGLQRVAVLGTAGIEDERIRRAFERPDSRTADRFLSRRMPRDSSGNPAPDGRHMKRAAKHFERELEHAGERSEDSGGHGDSGGGHWWGHGWGHDSGGGSWGDGGGSWGDGGGGGGGGD